MARYVRSDLLQPGDIILLRSKGKISTVISAVSGGKYSHAAIVISPTILFESNDEGVWFKPLAFSRCILGDKACELYADVGEYLAFDVFRHNALVHAGVDQLRKLQASLVTLTSQYNFLEYPSYEVFEKIVEDRTVLITPAIYRTLLALSGQTFATIVPGPFCSQLVAGLFRELALPLLSQIKDLDRISPNDIASSTSLIKQKNVVVNALPKSVGDAEVLKSANRIAGRLRRELEEHHYVARKLQETELLRRVLVDVSRGPGVDEAAIPAANQAVAKVFSLLQESDLAKVQQTMKNEENFFKAIRQDDPKAALLNDAVLGEAPKVVTEAEYKREIGPCFRPIVEVLKRHGGDAVYERLKAVTKSAGEATTDNPKGERSSRKK